MYHKYVEMHKAINLKKSGGNKKATVDGEAYCDRGSEQHIENRSEARQKMWETHVKSPTVALEEALRRTENEATMAQYTLAGESET